MALLLRVMTSQGPALAESSTHVVGAAGAHIGRSKRCDLILPDPECYVSNVHAAINREPRGWVLTDRSTNGTFINGAGAPLPPHSSHVLRDADRITIGPYTLVVAITPDQSFNGTGQQSRS